MTDKRTTYEAPRVHSKSKYFWRLALSRMTASIALAIAVISCGEISREVAVEMRPRIVFSKEIVRVSFVLSEGFKTTQELESTFGELGSVFLRYNPTSQESLLGVQMVASPDMLQSHHPSSDFNEFPGGQRLRRLFKVAPLKLWSQLHDGVYTGILYSPSDQLLTGGVISSEHFRLLRPGYFSTQSFRAANGDTIGMVVVVGPERNDDDFPGGIFFLTDYGLNPFSSGGAVWANLADRWLLRTGMPLEPR